MIIKINIADKRPTVEGSPVIRCSNNDYVIRFSFDEEWDPEAVKTARFTWHRGGQPVHMDVPLLDDMVELPLLSGVPCIYVDVYTDNLRTATPACIECEGAEQTKEEEPIVNGLAH